MRRPGGHHFSFDAGGGEHVQDTFTCAHCNRIVGVKPMCDPADAGGLCRQCDRLICPTCVGKGCRPLEKWLEQVEARARRDRLYRDMRA